MKTFTRTLAAVLAVATLSLTACGSDEPVIREPLPLPTEPNPIEKAAIDRVKGEAISLADGSDWPWYVSDVAVSTGEWTLSTMLKPEQTKMALAMCEAYASAIAEGYEGGAVVLVQDEDEEVIARTLPGKVTCSA